MTTTIPAAPTSPLRQRLIDDMTVRRFSAATQRSYIRDVGRFASFLGRPPDTATICAASSSGSAMRARRRRP